MAKKETKSVASDKKEATESLKEYKSKDGKCFCLSDRTPKTLNVNGSIYTKEELLKNKEAMEFLIVGGSGFVKQIK